MVIFTKRRLLNIPAPLWAWPSTDCIRIASSDSFDTSSSVVLVKCSKSCRMSSSKSISWLALRSTRARRNCRPRNPADCDSRHYIYRRRERNGSSINLLSSQKPGKLLKHEADRLVDDWDRLLVQLATSGKNVGASWPANVGREPFRNENLLKASDTIW